MGRKAVPQDSKSDLPLAETCQIVYGGPLTWVLVHILVVSSHLFDYQYLLCMQLVSECT